MTPTREEIAATYDLDKERKTTTKQVWSDVIYLDWVAVEEVVEGIQKCASEFRRRHEFSEEVPVVVSVEGNEAVLYADKEVMQRDDEVVDSIYFRLQGEQRERDEYARLKKKFGGEE